MEFKPINLEDIPKEVIEYATRYINKTKVANYMRPTAYAALIDGALFAKGLYIQKRDKNGLKIESDLTE